MCASCCSAPSRWDHMGTQGACHAGEKHGARGTQLCTSGAGRSSSPPSCCSLGWLCQTSQPPKASSYLSLKCRWPVLAHSTPVSGRPGFKGKAEQLTLCACTLSSGEASGGLCSCPLAPFRMPPCFMPHLVPASSHSCMTSSNLQKDCRVHCNWAFLCPAHSNTSNEIKRLHDLPSGWWNQ
jgi:hypothetical protein